MARRKTINLNPFDHDTLARLYVVRRIATDRYMHRQDDLRDLTATFNGLTGREDTPEDILHYMQSKRRHKGKWPTLNGNHLRLPIVVGRLVDFDHLPVLAKLHLEFNVGPETFTHNRELARALECRFFEETGVRKRGYVLATAMIEFRKDGKLPKTGRRRDDGFTDFDAAEDAG
jgi:hypothetical protein